MDSNGRRRRKRNYSRSVRIQQGTSWFNGVCTFLVLVCLIIITYHLLERHCQRYKQNDIYNFTRTMNDLAGPVGVPWEYYKQIYDLQFCQYQNLHITKNSYIDLENKLMKISEDLSKIEQQISILDTLASMMGKGDFARNKLYWYENNRNIAEKSYKTMVPYVN